MGLNFYYIYNLLKINNYLQVVELARGIEPPTSGLQNRCSAIELRQLHGYCCVLRRL